MRPFVRLNYLNEWFKAMNSFGDHHLHRSREFPRLSSVRLSAVFLAEARLVYPDH